MRTVYGHRSACTARLSPAGRCTLHKRHDFLDTAAGENAPMNQESENQILLLTACALRLEHTLYAASASASSVFCISAHISRSLSVCCFRWVAATGKRGFFSLQQGLVLR